MGGMMTKEEKLANILECPEIHHHDFDGLMMCCIVDGVVDTQVMDAHPAVGYNGGQKCDVTKGPCSCGAWH
jgi:hypothetical protein